MSDYIIYLIIMAVVTYLIRAVPLIVCKGKIENKFINAFLDYIPYTVLSAMTFPAVFYSTGSMYSALPATLTALFLAYKKKSLLTVAIGAVAVALVINYAMKFI